MFLFDTHCHLDRLEGLDAQLEEAVGRHVGAIVLPAVEPDNWARCVEIARGAARPAVYVALGIHPQVVRELSDAQLDEALERLPEALREAGAVAVGELGLDHRWDRDEAQRARQRRVFIRQLDIAYEVGLPPLIHCLDAYEPVLKAWSEHPICRAGVPGVMHGYSGSAAMVARYVEKNLFISFGGAITWQGARRAPEACVATPDVRLLIETDAPYMSPHPLDGLPNRPDRLVEIAARAASLRSTTPEQLAAQTWDNASALFGVPR
jgi:TatD DNase family protein